MHFRKVSAKRRTSLKPMRQIPSQSCWYKAVSRRINIFMTNINDKINDKNKLFFLVFAEKKWNTFCSVSIIVAKVKKVK